MLFCGQTGAKQHSKLKKFRVIRDPWLERGKAATKRLQTICFHKLYIRPTYTSIDGLIM